MRVVKGNESTAMVGAGHCWSVIAAALIYRVGDAMEMRSFKTPALSASPPHHRFADSTPLSFSPSLSFFLFPFLLAASHVQYIGKIDKEREREFSHKMMSRILT